MLLVVTRLDQEVGRITSYSQSLTLKSPFAFQPQQNYGQLGMKNQQNYGA